MRRFVTALIFVALAASPLAAADKPAPFPDFTFKRLKPPKPGATRRITVQIAPVEPAAVAAAPEATAKAAAPAASGYEWFWDAVPDQLGISGAQRLQDAMGALARGPSGTPVPGPRLTTLRRIADAHGADILVATVGKDVSPALVLAVIAIESAGNVTAVSSAGASGLMQLMPDTATRFDVSDTTNTTQNIRGGVAYLDWLTRHFDGDVMLALAGYNAGENAVTRNGGVPPYAETRAYVPKVLAAWNVARGLCQTRPELITDGCVFVRGTATTGG